MKKIISIILIATLCMNSVGGAGITLAQNNYGIENNLENGLDKNEESVEESSIEETDLDSDIETEKEEDYVDVEDAEKEDEVEIEEETTGEEVEVETEESSDELESETKEEIVDDEMEIKESEIEIEDKKVTEEETYENGDDLKVASISEMENINEKNKLFGAEDYTGKTFKVFLNLSKTYNNKVLQRSQYPDIYENRYELVSGTCDMYGQFWNSGYEEDRLRMSKSDWGGFIETIELYFIYETKQYEDVVPIYNKNGDKMYYVESIRKENSGTEINLKNTFEYYFHKDEFKKVNDGGEVRYELDLYPKEYLPLPVESYTYEFIDPETKDTLGTYSDSLSNYNYLSDARDKFNSGSLNIDFPVYSDAGSAYTFKTWEDYTYTDSANYNRTRKFHNAYKTLDSYDPELDADVDKSNPFTFSYKLVPERSDIYELPLTEYEQELQEQFPNYVPTALITKRNFKLVLEVYQMGDVKYYTNDGSEQIDVAMVSFHTQITTGKWPNSFPSPGVYKRGYYIRGWNREPGQDRNADETESLVGQPISTEDIKKGLKLYAVGDYAKEFVVNYDLNPPSYVSPTWTVQRNRDKDYYTHDGHNTMYFMHFVPKPVGVTYIDFNVQAFYRDESNHIVLEPKFDEEFIGEDGKIYNKNEKYRSDLLTKEQWEEVFGDDNQITFKYNWEGADTKVKFKFRLKGRTEGYLGTEWVEGDGLKILDNLNEKLTNDYLVNLYKTKNSDYKSNLDPYITYEVDKVEYSAGSTENDILVAHDAEVIVYLAKKVKFTYYDARGNDITATISSLAAKDNKPYVENDLGAFPMNPLENTANKELGVIVPNKKVTGWRRSLTSTSNFTNFNSEYSFSNDYYLRKLNDTQGT